MTGVEHVTVQMAPVLDGNPPHLAEFVPQADEKPCNVAEVLKSSGAEMLLKRLPSSQSPTLPSTMWRSRERAIRASF